MTPEQWKGLVDFMDENIVLEEKFGFKPRFKELKGDLLAIQHHGNPVTIEEMDWDTLDALCTEKYNELLKDYAVQQVRNRNE